MNNKNTKNMTEDELKATLKERAHAEGKDLTDPRNRYTIWSENGVWSENALHLIFEGFAANLSEKDRAVRECALKTSYSRIMVLDALQDRIDIVLPDGHITVAIAR
jgi:hypothetical protein